MKKFIAGLLVGLILATAGAALAANPINLIVNGQEIYPDVPPQVINGRVMVPARFVAEPLGAKVDWDGSTNSVIITSAPTEAVSQTAPEETNLEGESLVADEWVSFDTLMREKNIFIMVGDKVVLRGGNVEISFEHPRVSDQIITVTTDEAYDLTLKIENARFYMVKSELQSIGLIP